MSRAKEAMRNLFLTSVVFGGVYLLVVYGEIPYLIEENIVPQPGTPIPLWISDFKDVTYSTMVFAGLGFAMWYTMASFTRINHWQDASMRGAWVVIFIVIVVVSTGVAIYYLPSTQSGGIIAYTTVFINSIILYYTSTCLFSPYTFKYTAVGSSKVRPRWL